MRPFEKHKISLKVCIIILIIINRSTVILAGPTVRMYTKNAIHTHHELDVAVVCIHAYFYLNAWQRSTHVDIEIGKRETKTNSFPIISVILK